MVAEAVGTVPYYCAPGRPLGVNPALALVRPPKVLVGYPAEHLLTGHGAGLREDVPGRLAEAVRRSRRDLPRVARRIVGARRRSR